MPSDRHRWALTAFVGIEAGVHWLRVTGVCIAALRSDHWCSRSNCFAALGQIIRRVRSDQQTLYWCPALSPWAAMIERAVGMPLGTLSAIYQVQVPCTPKRLPARLDGPHPMRPWAPPVASGRDRKTRNLLVSRGLGIRHASGQPRCTSHLTG